MKRYQIQRGYEPEVLERLHNVQLEILRDFMDLCEKYNLNYFVAYGTALGAVRHKGFIPWDDDIDVCMLREDYNKLFQVFDQELGEKYALLTPEIDERYACTVTHIQKKGTKFISEMSKDLKCEQRIFMDVFPLDHIAFGIKERKRQTRMTFFWGKLLFLSGTAYPVIPIKGVLGKLAAWTCVLIHIVLKFFRVSPKTLYKNYVKEATAYNCEKGSEYVTCFESTDCDKEKIKIEQLFPLKKVKFENLEVNIPADVDAYLRNIYGDYMELPPEEQRINHMPLVIEFGDE